jgi:hypothetical protein
MTELYQEVTFQTPLGEGITGYLKEVRLDQTSRGVETFFIKLEVDYDTYEQIDEQGWFNLLPETRNDLALEKLEDQVPVELEAILRPALAYFVLEKGLRPDEVDKLLAQPAAEYGFLQESESWLTYTVMQQIPLPEEVEDKNASLKIGYKTLWQTSPAESPASMADIVQQFFLEQRWPYEDMGEQLYRVQVEGGEAEWVCLVKLDEERHFCLVYSVLAEAVPPKKRTRMSLFLAETNYDIGVGSFEMDPEDGEVRFRTSIDVEGDRLSRALFERLVTMNITMMDQYIESLLEMIRG